MVSPDDEFNSYFSPITDRTDINTKKTGGRIDTKSGMFQIVILTILIILVCWFIYQLFQQIKIDDENFYQRNLREHFNNIHGEQFDDDAKYVIQYGEQIANPRAIDHYRLGTVYLLNAHDPINAHHHFEQALNQVIEGKVDNREIPFLLNRIADFADLYVDVDLPENENELPLQHAILVHFENQMGQLQHVAKKKQHINPDDPEFKQKTILSRQNWQPDSQNVHDSAVYSELREQVNQVIMENEQIPDIEMHTYDEALNWLAVRYKDSPKKDAIGRAIAVININAPLTSINQYMGERDLLTAIWQRTYDPANKDNAVAIREALADALYDCVEGGHVVCLTGRTAKLWQSLAKLDKDPTIGIFKTKQVLRNEIYDLAAKVVDDLVGENGSASAQLKEAYLTDQDTTQVAELKAHMREKIAAIADDYKDLLSETQIALIIAECQAVI